MVLTPRFPAALRAGDYLADSDLWQGWKILDVRRDGADVVFGLHNPFAVDPYHLTHRRVRADRPVLRIDSDFGEFLDVCRRMLAIADGEAYPPPCACG